MSFKFLNGLILKYLLRLIITLKLIYYKRLILLSNGILNLILILTFYLRFL